MKHSTYANCLQQDWVYQRTITCDEKFARMLWDEMQYAEKYPKIYKLQVFIREALSMPSIGMTSTLRESITNEKYGNGFLNCHLD
jgi:hypothetical protein